MLFISHQNETKSPLMKASFHIIGRIFVLSSCIQHTKSILQMKVNILKELKDYFFDVDEDNNDVKEKRSSVSYE
jgi:hypothetical protein